ncbi:MAG: cysteine desulfurase [Gammaproteobacteria bacterium]|nr:cysteine desulfurase [Gammaproteobacteria bacterium]
MTSYRKDFPILDQQVNGAPLVYLDNAATSQKPRAVIDALSDYYRRYNSNVHRAVHALADQATVAFEHARDRVREFINAEHRNEIIFTRGTTESINLVANCYTGLLKPGDEILISHMEHHSNIVPWQMLASRTEAVLKACDVNSQGDIDIDSFTALLSDRTRIVAIGHVSNALGTVNPLQQIIELAHSAGAVVVVDGAQAVPHFAVDVVALDCDFYAFSGHKMYGPTGIGVLYGKEKLLDVLPPWQGGGEMIETVTIDKSTYNTLPYKFEAGTPNIAGAIGLGAAIEYLGRLPRCDIEASEDELVRLTLSQLKQIDGVRLVGEPEKRIAVVSFLVDGSHPHDVGTLLDQQGIAVRTGHHCAMPLMARLGIPGTVRASFSLYNSTEDVNRLIAGVRKAVTFM